MLPRGLGEQPPFIAPTCVAAKFLIESLEYQLRFVFR